MYELLKIPINGTIGTNGQPNVSGGGKVGKSVNTNADTTVVPKHKYRTDLSHSFTMEQNPTIELIVNKSVKKMGFAPLLCAVCPNMCANCDGISLEGQYDRR
mmetsp:Transcript_25462/g.35712  ORF Transcript_25462/g.35712 Transcript_25462/m.35712 type:complete len:102 (-) Transcript_25462:323-628(-)